MIPNSNAAKGLIVSTGNHLMAVGKFYYNIINVDKRLFINKIVK